MLLLAHQQGHTANAAVATASVVITGTAITELLESDVITGSKTLIFTVADDTWVATLGDDNSISTDFFAGLDSDVNESTGWNTKVRDVLAHGSLTRDSGTVATIILPATTDYGITADETVTMTVPATALDGALAATATPTFDVTNANPAPGRRTHLADAESRTFVIQPENRTYLAQ